MSKYIIDTETWADLFEVQRVGVYGIGNDIVTDEKTVWSRMFRLDELKELNSDYINEHFERLQDEAYQAGMDKAWEAVKKIALGPEDGALNTHQLKEIFGTYFVSEIIRGRTAQEVIDKVTAYESKQKEKDCIEVGDEVISDTGNRFTVTGFANSNDVCGFSERGLWCFNTIDKLTKTGKHYDIASILEAMRE